jgi:hypothetical protein
VEQSLGWSCGLVVLWSCRLAGSRSERTYELTSSIAPRGRSCRRAEEIGFLPIAFDPAWLHSSAAVTLFTARSLAIFGAHALSQDHFDARTSMIFAGSQSIARIISLPHLDIVLVRSILPYWYLEDVRPNTAPTALEFRKQAGTSTVAR